MKGFVIDAHDGPFKRSLAQGKAAASRNGCAGPSAFNTLVDSWQGQPRPALQAPGQFGVAPQRLPPGTGYGGAYGQSGSAIACLGLSCIAHMPCTCVIQPLNLQRPCFCHLVNYPACCSTASLWHQSCLDLNAVPSLASSGSCLLHSCQMP